MQAPSAGPGALRAAAARVWARRFTIAYVALSAWLAGRVALFHDAHTGFTPLVVFGDRYAPSRLASLREVPIYSFRDSAGYDGQFYAQLAVAGNPFDPQLQGALDSPGYRARRVLIPMLAHVAGLGRPAWVLDAYALANLVCWLILAWLLARWWFPPTDIDKLLRWAGTMFGAGVIVSVTRSLTDLPALLFIAVGVRLVERERRWLGAVILGAAGLVRETSVLAAGVFVRPGEAGASRWRRALAAAALCAAPAILWSAAIRLHYGPVETAALGGPFVALAGAFRELAHRWHAGGFQPVRHDVYVVVALLAQVALVFARPKPAQAWWRIGCGFALMSILLGRAVWEDPLFAAPRTFLPLTLAFNVLIPRGRRWLVLLCLGNLTVLSARPLLSWDPSQQTTFALGITADYGPGFFGPEHRRRTTWRWASGAATMRLHNPGADAVQVRLDFELASQTDREVRAQAGAFARSFAVSGRRPIGEALGPFVLPAGDTIVSFSTPQPAWTETAGGHRQLAFALRDLALVVVPPP